MNGEYEGENDEVRQVQRQINELKRRVDKLEMIVLEGGGN